MQLELGARDMRPGRSHRLGRAAFFGERDQALTGISAGSVAVDPEAQRAFVHRVFGLAA